MNRLDNKCELINKSQKMKCYRVKMQRANLYGHMC